MLAGVECVVQRHLRSRYNISVVPLPAWHRVRSTRRRKPRRVSARSRSLSSYPRECQCRDYQRSHSCPEYPVLTNTYKFSENNKDYIIETSSMPRLKPNIPMPSVSQYIVVPAKPCYSYPSVIQTGNNQTIKNIVPNQKSLCKLGYLSEEYLNSVSLPLNSTKIQRILPNNKELSRYIMVSLPLNPPNNPVHNVHKEVDTVIKSGVNYANKTLLDSQCYDLEDGDYESKVSAEKQTNNNTLGIFNSTVAAEPKNDISAEGTKLSPPSQNNRKKLLSLQLKPNYDFSDKNTKVNIPKSQNATPKNKNFNINCKIQRRYSDSLVFSKSTSLLTTPEKLINIFKKMTVSSYNYHYAQLNDSISFDVKENKIRKHGNTVSIDETPYFQDYRSPNSLSAPSSIDLSLKKPLPSIIKKARTRSHSLASNDRIDREFSIIANSLSVALSPLNPGSRLRRALTPVGSHLPLDETSYTNHVSTTTSITSEKMIDEHNTSLPRNAKHRSVTCKNRRQSKSSNDYGGRENGRNNNQQQPLERRESRRGQFTRSL